MENLGVRISLGRDLIAHKSLEGGRHTFRCVRIYNPRRTGFQQYEQQAGYY